MTCTRFIYPFTWGKDQSSHWGFPQMLHARHLRTGNCEKQGTSETRIAVSEHCLKNVQTPVPRGELKPPSVTTQSRLGETGHLHSAEFSSKGIWREKNPKASEDLHNSLVQYNLCFMWENYLRLGNSLLISQTWGMSSRSGRISSSFQQKWKTFYCKRQVCL